MQAYTAIAGYGTPLFDYSLTVPNELPEDILEYSSSESGSSYSGYVTPESPASTGTPEKIYSSGTIFGGDTRSGIKYGSKSYGFCDEAFPLDFLEPFCDSGDYFDKVFDDNEFTDLDLYLLNPESSPLLSSVSNYNINTLLNVKSKEAKVNKKLHEPCLGMDEPQKKQKRSYKRRNPKNKQRGNSLKDTDEPRTRTKLKRTRDASSIAENDFQEKTKDNLISIVNDHCYTESEHMKHWSPQHILFTMDSNSLNDNTEVAVTKIRPEKRLKMSPAKKLQHNLIEKERRCELTRNIKGLKLVIDEGYFGVTSACKSKKVNASKKEVMIAAQRCLSSLRKEVSDLLERKGVPNNLENVLSNPFITGKPLLINQHREFDLNNDKRKGRR